MKTRFCKLTAWLLTLAILMTFIPSFTLSVFAAGGTYDFSTSQDRLIINSSNLSTYNGATVTGEWNWVYESYGSLEDLLIIDGVEVDLTICDLILTSTVKSDRCPSPIELRNGATLNLTITGNNTLESGSCTAGIHVPEGCTLNITATSTGTLIVRGGSDYGGGAGIGADGSGALAEGENDVGETQTCGIINIAGGTIIATGGVLYRGGKASLGGAGIGGSACGEGGAANTGIITISGGNVTATGGGGAAGIGGGETGYVESISITGGVVKAKAEYGAAIGTGEDANTSNDIACGDAMQISITGGTVTADGNIGYGVVVAGDNMTGGSISIGSGASVMLTDDHKIDHGDADGYAVIPVAINVYDGRLADGTVAAVVEATQSGTRVGGAWTELTVSDYCGRAAFNFVVPAGNCNIATDFTVSADGFTASTESAVTLSADGITVNCGRQLYTVTLTFLDDDKFRTASDEYTATLTVTTAEGGIPDASAIMATFPTNIEFHSRSMGTMVVWLAAGTYEISVTSADLNNGAAMNGNITVSSSANLNLLDNSSAEILGELDLSYGPVRFYTKNSAYKVDYYTSKNQYNPRVDTNKPTTATVLATAPFVVTQSGTATTTNTIIVENWGDSVPLDLTIDGLNIETIIALDKANNAGHIDINGSAVKLNLSGSSSLKSTYYPDSKFSVALVSVDGSSSLTIGGSGSLTVNTEGYGAAIGGDYYSDVGAITINSGTVTAVNNGLASAIGTGFDASADSQAKITINGGKITAHAGSNGENTAIGAAYSDEKGVRATITINGGEVEALGVIGAENRVATVTISGGAVSATAENSYATIGSSADTSMSDGSVSVIISGGTVTAVNTGTGPAIGGRGISEKQPSVTNKTAGNITITGGTVTATNNSETDATIGAHNGYHFHRTNVIISGGKVTATNNTAGGVAIGGSKDTSGHYAYTDVTINGGTVVANGIIGSVAQTSTKYANVKFNGGSINGQVWAYSTENTNDGATNGTSAVYMITADLSSKLGVEKEVETASITGNVNYGFNDVYTDASGKIYLWLPNESDDNGTTKATFNGMGYTGNVLTTNNGVFVADKLIPTVTAPTAKTLTYDSTEQDLVTAGTTTGGTMQYSLDNVAYSTDIPARTNAGTYTIYYKVVGDDDYKDVAASSVSATILPKVVTNPTFDGLVTTQLYTGSAIEPTFTLKDGEAVIPQSEYTVTYSDNTNVGEATITITDKEGGNYNVSGSAKFTIEIHTHSYTNGFCICDEYQEPELKDGYYQIENAGHLYWFANYINTVDRTANAVLVNDIDLENRPWTPIGSTGETSNNFRGHFDGQNHTITNFYLDMKRAGLGFFGEVRLGTVENFTIYGEVKLNGDCSYVGGVIGSAPGANGTDVPDHNGATIRNITSYVNVTLGEGSHGSSYVGGFMGYANHETVIENCSWYGILDLGPYRADSGVGGLVGKAQDNSNVTISNCAAYGTIRTYYKSGTYSNYDTIYIGGFLSFSADGAATTLKNNLWAGKIINETDLGDKAHISAFGTLRGAESVTNCYALNSAPYITTENKYTDGITTVTAQQLASGEVAYKLGTAWGQDLKKENSLPEFGEQKVYKYTEGYSNELKFGFVDYTTDGATFNVPTAGTYSLIFADYEDEMLNDVDIVPVTVTDEIVGEITKASVKGINLSAGDKIMLWQDMTNIKLLCDAYIVK